MVNKMDLDIGTILYIVITIAVIIAGAIGKKKKPAASKSVSDGGSKPKGFFDKLGEELEGFVNEAKGSVKTFTDELKPDESKTRQVFQQEATEYNEFLRPSEEESIQRNSSFMDYEGEYDPDSEENTDLFAHEAIRTTAVDDIMEVIDIDETSNPSYFDVVEDFDLREAIIYSIVINRIEY
jgi:hypothetical protein